MKNNLESAALTRQSAIRFVVILGIVSLFADFTYEGARSITGPYLAILGASGTVVGVVAGLGELIGYATRLLSGYISDRTRSYWTITFIGYAINLLAVPLLAFTDQWITAAGLIVIERLGKAIRSPARDAMLSYATHVTGRGWGFGLHEALDQVGAVFGPLCVAGVLYFGASYALSFGLLLIPALAAFTSLVAAHWLYPHPEDLEVKRPALKVKGFTPSYWFYVAAMSLVAAGYVDFSLIAFHFERAKIASPAWIPLIYSLAMGVDGIASLFLGRWFDRFGISILLFSTALSALFAPMVFLAGLDWAIAGMILWGIGMGAQESIVRAVVAQMVGTDQRATAYGMLNLWFGIFWFAGSALMGFLYDHSILILVLFSVVIQLAAIPFLWMVKRKMAD